MVPIRKRLLGLLENGSVKYDEVCKKLAEHVGTIGFSPGDAIAAAVADGYIDIHADGNKTWVRKSAPFVQLTSKATTDYVGNGPNPQVETRYNLVFSGKGVKFRPGQQITVKWPDGMIGLAKVCVQASDEGIEVTYHGVELWVPLDTKGLLVRSDCF